MSIMLMKQILFKKYPSSKNMSTFDVNDFAKSIYRILLLKKNTTLIAIEYVQLLMQNIRRKFGLNNIKSEIEKIDLITEISPESLDMLDGSDGYSSDISDPDFEFCNLTIDVNKRPVVAKAIKNDVIKFFGLMRDFKEKQEYAGHLVCRLKLTKTEIQRWNIILPNYY